MSDLAEQVKIVTPYIRGVYELGFNLLMLFLFLKVTGLWDRFAPAVLKGKGNGKDSNGKEAKSGITLDTFAEQMHRRFDGMAEEMGGLGRRFEQVRSQTERIPHLQSTLDRLAGRIEGMDQQMDEIQKQVQESVEISKWLKEVHNRTDANGTYIWYVQRGMPERLAELANMVKELTVELNTLAAEINGLSSPK